MRAIQPRPLKPSACEPGIRTRWSGIWFALSIATRPSRTEGLDWAGHRKGFGPIRSSLAFKETWLQREPQQSLFVPLERDEKRSPSPHWIRLSES